MNKTIIIKIASEIMLKNGCEAVSIDNISNRTGISVDKLYQTFPQGSEEILMDCVEYTGRKWTETIKKLVMNETGELNKINKLSSMYFLGTKEHSSSPVSYTHLDVYKRQLVYMSP